MKKNFLGYTIEITKSAKNLNNGNPKADSKRSGDFLIYELPDL